MPAQGIGTRAPSERPCPHFGPQHALAKLVARLCRMTGHRAHLQGSIGCGPCWEKVIRRDQDVATEFGLGPIEVDRSYIDRVAVEAALAGRNVELTDAERAVFEAEVDRLTGIDGDGQQVAA